jgi:hypothetical protein
MSKSILTAFVLCLVSIQPTFAKALAAPPVVLASCGSKFVADAGYTTVVTRDVYGQVELSLEEISFFGTTPIGSLNVLELEDRETVTRTYVGRGVTLSIDLSKATHGYFDAKLSGAALPTQEFTDLTCDVTNPELAPLQPIDPNQPICLAYFWGASFNPETGSCEMGGQSGCSNPFRFSDVASCESAFSLHR